MPRRNAEQHQEGGDRKDSLANALSRSQPSPVSMRAHRDAALAHALQVRQHVTHTCVAVAMFPCHRAFGDLNESGRCFGVDYPNLWRWTAANALQNLFRVVSLIRHFSRQHLIEQRIRSGPPPEIRIINSKP